MSDPQATITDELVLAAVDRGERHNPRTNRGVAHWTIYEHLDTRKQTAQARQIRVRLDVLEADGALERFRRNGIPVYRLTATGRRRLDQLQATGRLPQLPESPQHRAWAAARTLAREEINRFRDELGETVLQTLFMLEEDPAAASDRWFAQAERLRRTCWRLGSATHCLHEWAEPDDARADIDDHCEPADDTLDRDERWHRESLRAGRRTTALWDDPANLRLPTQ